MDKSILEVVHKEAKGLFEAGLLDEVTMTELDALCLPPIKKFTASQIKKLRLRNKASQAVFATFLNTSKSTIQQWEQELKSPNGPPLKLLNLVDQKGLEVLV